jgi:hypothetical protein
MVCESFRYPVVLKNAKVTIITTFMDRIEPGDGMMCLRTGWYCWNAVDMFRGGNRFETWLGYRPSWLRLCTVLSSPLRRLPYKAVLMP